ncbi:ATP-dependent RNA helicase DBP10 [Metarhizium anisopliae]
MPRRAASPAASEPELDILDSLYPGEDADSNQNFPADRDSRKEVAFKPWFLDRLNTNADKALGLNSNLLKAIARKGFSVPTPIQRKTIPLVLDRKDVVGMARTGSGKTGAFVIPMIEKLRAHSGRFGSRALILSPSRELAIQTLKVVKEFARGTDLKAILLVGGDSLEEQFGYMAANPDIVIATPGRFLHLKVEMSLDLSSIKYVVFDEADRLFEMGFATQLTEILHALSPSRQTLLFSATLPASLVEFARAASKKRKRGESGSGKPTEHSTIIFTATKHHVEYLANVLQRAGFAVSHVYGSLDQTARRNQVEDFRRGRTNILVVTDVAARGIDIPVLANVINYDFPSQPKIFVHRVGRTARAGQRGWSYSLVRDSDAPYLLDLQLFLGRRLVLGQEGEEPSFASDVVVGSLKRDLVGSNVEWMNKLLHEDVDVSTLRGVAAKAEKLYLKTRNSASSQSAKRSRELVSSTGWNQLHRLFGDDVDNMEQARADMLARISSFKPQETIFEISHTDKSHSEAAEVMKQLRKKITPKNRQAQKQESDIEDDDIPTKSNDNKMDMDSDQEASDHGSQGADQTNGWDEDELEVTVSNTDSKRGKTDWRDSEVFMSYTPRTHNAAEERGYGVHSGGFVEAARDAAMDLTNDETAKSFGQPSRSKMRWDAKSKKYVSRDNDEDGSKGKKMITGESGVKIAATFQSGRYDKWKKAQRIRSLPRVGEAEKPGTTQGLPSGVRYKHKLDKAPKEADKYRDDFMVRKKRVDEAREKRQGRFRDGMGSKKELKGADDIRKERQEKERKRAKNARPSKKR